MSTIKLFEKKDFRVFVDIATNAYPRTKIITEEDKQKAAERYQKMQKDNSTKNFYGLYRDGKMLGGMLFHDYEMNFARAEIKVGGVGFVAVDLLHKKEKVAKELITYFLQYYKRKGTHMTSLYPFRPDFYKKMGFGIGTKMSQYRVKPMYLPKGISKSNIHFISENEKQNVMDCYNRFYEKRHGMFKKTLFETSSIFTNPDNRIVGYKKNGNILGYIVFNFEKDDRESFVVNDIHVHEFIYENREAFLELMTFLHSQDDQIRHIVFDTQDEYFHHLLFNPTNGTNNMIPSVYHESNIQGVGIMYRVVDVKGIFETLKNHNFGNQNCKLKLNIRDTFLHENDGSYIIYIDDGTAEVKENDQYEVEVSLDISDFSSLLMGVIDFKSLYRYGQADISSTEYINVINKVFLTEEKPMCTTPF